MQHVQTLAKFKAANQVSTMNNSTLIDIPLIATNTSTVCSTCTFILSSGCFSNPFIGSLVTHGANTVNPLIFACPLLIFGLLRSNPSVNNQGHCRNTRKQPIKSDQMPFMQISLGAKYRLGNGFCSSRSYFFFYLLKNI